MLKTAKIGSSITIKVRKAKVHAHVQFIHSEYFNINLFKSAFKHESDCNDIAQRSEQKVMVEIGFQWYTLQKYFEPLTELAVHYK